MSKIKVVILPNSAHIKVIDSSYHNVHFLVVKYFVAEQK